MPKNVVIVGGGGSGAQLARLLSSKLDSSAYHLILISSRNYFTHLPGALRMVTTSQGHLEEKVLIPYDKLFIDGKGTFKHASVVSVQPNSTGGKGDEARGGTVLLDNGETIPYEALVLATGSKWEGPLDFPPDIEDAKSLINEWRKKIQDSKGVIIAGGGAVGSGESPSPSSRYILKINQSTRGRSEIYTQRRK